jgi:hypothetical protein
MEMVEVSSYPSGDALFYDSEIYQIDLTADRKIPHSKDISKSMKGYDCEYGWSESI